MNTTCTSRPRASLARAGLALVLFGAPALAQQNNYSVGPPVLDNSAEAELASFEIAEGYQISLFASEKDGIANPIAMRWGPEGRLWVLCSLVYPQAVPTEAPNDKLYILEDRDHDGRADQTRVFADGLDMPTGFALGNGGVYLAEGEDLLFLRDTDGDDHADSRETLFTGFGTGDTHQNINSLSWSPGGELLFAQGLHNFARVETPWGIVRLNEHGIWRLRPKRLQLHAFRGCSGQNPWGISFGQWGEPFAKSNNTEVSELLPVMVHTDHYHEPLDIGATRIKSMICEIIDSPALPADLQGNIVIAGYFGHLVDRLAISPDGAGHKGELLAPLWRTGHQSFRPVDVQTGPDGALYVADWYNPIIGHYQASLRHPHRDRTHGRIWRLTAANLPTGPLPDLTTIPTKDLLARLEDAPLKERERIRVALSHRGSEEVLAAVDSWLGALEAGDPRHEHHLFEALALFEWHERVNRPLLEKLLAAREPLARAYATRVVGRWHDRLENPMGYLEVSIADPHPRVRLEAVVAASQLNTAAAMEVAARALDAPTDRFLDAALRQTAHALHPHWFAALQKGGLRMPDRHLAFVLQQSTGQSAAQAARELLQQGSIANADEAYAPLCTILATQGTVDDLNWLVSRWWEHKESAAPLGALVEAARLRGLVPTHNEINATLRAALDQGAEEHRFFTLQLAGLWTIAAMGDDLLRIAADADSATRLRVAAIESMSRLPRLGDQRLPVLEALAAGTPDPAVRQAALASLLDLDAARGARLAAGHLASSGPDDSLVPYLVPFLAREGGDAILATALREKDLSPAVRAKLQGSLGAAGVHSESLRNLLAPAGAAQAIGIPEFSEELVTSLSAEVRQHGDSKRGSEVYHRDALGCTMCHVIDFCGRAFGPDLSAVGAGVPVEILIESVLWPRRQIKEGFLSTTISTREGKVFSGHLKHEDAQRIVIADAVTQQEQTIPGRDVAARQDAGSIMPPGLTASLKREELRDLIRFLSERKGQARHADESPAPQ